MNYLFLSKTEPFKGISENDLENIIKCLGATEKNSKNPKLFTRRAVLLPI